MGRSTPGERPGRAGVGMAEPGPGDRGQLAGLRSRPDLNGRRVEVRGQARGKDGTPRFAVRLLFGAGAGTVLKVKPANLELDKDRALDPAMATLVQEMQALAPGAVPEEERRDWAGGLPIKVLAKVAVKLVAQTGAGWADFLRGGCLLLPDYMYKDEEAVQGSLQRWKVKGYGLFAFAMVCKPWRKAQLQVGGRLCTLVFSDVIMPGSVALVKWALAEGCPRGNVEGCEILAHYAASHGHMELVQWLIQEQKFAMDVFLVGIAAGRNKELVRWLKAQGCPSGIEHVVQELFSVF